MPAVQRNFKWYRYVDDSARNWALRADADWGDSGNSGLAAFNVADAPFGRQTVRHRPRMVVYQDPTTFRTARYPVGTAAAFAALPATLNITIPGETAAVAYNLVAKQGEKLQAPRVARNLPDHA
jgi:hypothetical protein